MSKKHKEKKYSYSRDEIIEEIRKDTEVGKMFVKVEMDFLRAVSSGKIYKELSE